MEMADGTTDRFPMEEVARVPDEETGLVEVGGMGHIIVLSIADDGRVGIVASEDGNWELRPCGQMTYQHEQEAVVA